MPRIITVAAPSLKIVESCTQQPIVVNCPEIKCDDKSLKHALSFLYNLNRQQAEKLSSCYEERESLDNALKNEKDESEAWRKKYIDFSCS